MVIWSPGRASGFPTGTPDFSNTKITQKQTSVPTSMIYSGIITSYIIIKFKCYVFYNTDVF